MTLMTHKLTPSNVKEILQPHGVSHEVCEAIEKALTWATSVSSKNTGMTAGMAQGYLEELDRAGQFAKHDRGDYLYGVRFNIEYALGNMNGWRGEEAREAKKVLKAFAKES